MRIPSLRSRAARTVVPGLVLLVSLVLGCPGERYEPISFELPEAEPVTAAGEESDESFVLVRERPLSVVVGFLRALREEDAETLFSLVDPGSPLERELAPLREGSEEARPLYFAAWRARIGAHRGVQRIAGTGGSSAVTLPPEAQPHYYVRFELERDNGTFSLGSVIPQFDGFGGYDGRRSEQEVWNPLPEWQAAAEAPPTHGLAEELLAALADDSSRGLLLGPLAYASTLHESFAGDYATWHGTLREALERLAAMTEEARFVGAYERLRYRLTPDAHGMAGCRSVLALCFEGERRFLVPVVYGTDTDGRWRLLGFGSLEPQRWSDHALQRMEAYAAAAATTDNDAEGRE